MQSHEDRSIQAIAQGRRIAARQVSVREVVEQALLQVDADKKTNAWITVDAPAALAQAERVQARLDQGEKLSPLAGLPLAVKDNISTQGLRTTCGSRMLSQYVPPYDATVIERLKDAGLIILGKTNMDEFAMGSTTETSWFGAVANPWDPGRVPGGSSGGSAAALAAAQVTLALGSDTGGSIRQPCAWCGLTGIKPTYGTVSRFGLIAYASSLDQIGPMARNAEDCAALLALLAGPDERDSTSAWPDIRPEMDVHAAQRLATGDLRGVRIGLPEDYLSVGLQPDIHQAILKAAQTMEQLGAQVSSCRIDLVDEAVPAYYLVATAEASSNLARFDGIRYGFRPDENEPVDDVVSFYEKARTEGFGSEVQRRILLGTFALSAGYYDDWYLKALKVRRLVRDRYLAALEQFDLLLAPVSPTAALAAGSALSDPLAMYLADLYTVPANLAGLPALSLPCGLTTDGLPVGLQLIGRACADAWLLQVGQGFQQATDHHLHQPAGPGGKECGI